MKPSSPPCPVTAETIRAALAASDDFGHEVRTQALLKQYGATVQHGWTYLDPLEGKPRQFDLRARLDHPRLPRTIRLAVECKNLSPEVPLIISGTARERAEAFHDIVVANNSNNYDHVDILRARADQTNYPAGGFVGKNLLRLKPDKGLLVPSRNDETEIYNRWTQAIASADELCKDATKLSDRVVGKHYTVILPALVIPDDTLWIVKHHANGRMDLPEKADATTLFLNPEVVVVPDNHWMNLGHVHFFTMTGFDRFLTDLRKEKDTWDDWFPATSVAHTPPVH